MSTLLNNPNVVSMMEDAANEYDDLPTEVSFESRIIQEKILHILNLYPTISPSMLQVGIGTSIPPSIWRPLLDAFIKSGVIIRRTEVHRTPTDRMIEYVFLELSPLVIAESPSAV